MPLQDFTHTIDAVEEGIRRRWHTSVQLYVSVDGQPVLDAAVGDAAPGRHASSETVMLWRSAGKPLTAAAVCLFAERGLFQLNAVMKDVLSECAEFPVGDFTVRQLLCHNTDLCLAETGWPHETWSRIVDRVIQKLRRTGNIAYQPQATWFLLAELLQRVDPAGRNYAEIMADEILRPCGINDVWCGVPAGVCEVSGDRCCLLYVREKGQLAASPYSQPPWLSSPSPGGNWRGPVRELGRFYEMMLREGVGADGRGVLSASTIAEMTRPHRVGQFDHTFQHSIDFGLGVILDSRHHGQDTVPYGFGRHCSDNTFGHGGAQCAMGFCDLDQRIVVAWAANGFCGEGLHQKRNRSINEAIYRDLGFA